MDWNLSWGLLAVFAGTILGIFWTKTPGFGKYTTSTLLLTLVLLVASFAFVHGKIEASTLSNLLFAIAGYGGGLIVAKTGDN